MVLAPRGSGPEATFELFPARMGLTTPGGPLLTPAQPMPPDDSWSWEGEHPQPQGSHSCGVMLALGSLPPEVGRAGLS